MEPFKIEYGIGYQGTVLHVVEDDEALAICGNSVCSYSLKGGLNKPLIWGPRSGISVSAYDPSNNWIAFAEKGLHPSAYVYDVRKQQQHAKLTGIAEVEVSAVAFSKDGCRLITVSSEPDFKLCLWDLQEQEPSKLAEGSLEWLVEFASFSPASPEQFCLSGSGNLSVWTYERDFHRTSFSCKSYWARPHEPHCHVWSEDGQRIYTGGLKGEVIMFELTSALEPGPAEYNDKSDTSVQESLQDGLKTLLFDGMSDDQVGSKGGESWQVLRSSQNGEKVASICVGELHVVIAESGGRVCWLSLPSAKDKGKVKAEQSSPHDDGADKEASASGSISSAEEDHDSIKEDGAKGNDNSVDFDMKVDATKAASTIVYSMHIDVSDVTNMMYSTDQIQLIVGAASGCIVVIRINKDLLVSTLSGKPGTSINENFAAVQWRSAYHYGPILGFATLGVPL